MSILRHPGVVFLDRDGTINRKAPDGDYIERSQELEVLPGAASAVARLNHAGVRVIVVSNQRGIALGRMTEADLEDVNAELTRQLEDAAGAWIDVFFHCTHDVGECDCRKPDIGLFRQALERFPWIDLGPSAVVGDAASDIEAGRRLGVRTIQIGVDAPDLAGAVDELLAAPGG